MNMLEKVKEGLGKFKEERERNQAIKLNRDLAQSKRDFANAKIKEEIVKNKEFVHEVKARATEQRLAPFKAFVKSIKERTSKKAGKVRLGKSPGSTETNIFTQNQATGLHPIFHGGGSNTKNPFNQGGGTNPIYHGLGTSPVNQKEKKKSIIIRL